MPDSYNRIRHFDVDNQQSGRIARLLIVFLFVTFLCPLRGASSAAVPSPFEIEGLMGRGAPDFALRTVAGKPLSLSSFHGSVVLLNFWATWCPPCKEEMLSMNRLFQQYKGKGLVIIAVSADSSPAAVGRFVTDYPVNFDVIVDYQKKVSKDLYKVFMIPTTFLIDRRGIIVDKYFGGQDWTEKRMTKKIEALLWSDALLDTENR